MACVCQFEGLELEARLKVWNKARPLERKGWKVDENIWRIDAYGHVIRYGDHGDADSTYGWMIVRIKEELHPLHWRNDRR